MADYLIFQLYGPLAAWGGIAVGEVRPSWAHPSKSAVLGLLAGALGADRADEQAHLGLHEGLGLAVRVDHPGVPMHDFHTAQVPHSREGLHATRRAQLAPAKLETILSRREYRCDALYTVALWERGENPPSLKELAQALERPVYAPYLGRKSCPMGLPMAPRIISADTLREALEQVAPPAALDHLSAAVTAEVYWEETRDSGLTPVQSIGRRDALHSRVRWQFEARTEHQGTMTMAPVEE